MIKNAPFVEVKTFKKNHLLITIPESQFKEDNYYVIVKSNLNDDYLLHLFNDKFFENFNIDEFKLHEELIISKNKLINPSEIKKPNSIGYYELIGVYKGEQIEKISKLVGEGNYYYLNSIRKINSKNKINKKLSSGLYCHKKIT